MDPWYKIATLRKEVREGRSSTRMSLPSTWNRLSPRLPRKITGTRKSSLPHVFQRALREHAGMVLRRLSGATVNTAPVMTLITQFGGGKTHTLAALYHLVTNGEKTAEYAGVRDLISAAGIQTLPKARIAAFVDNFRSGGAVY